jgi:hypothetical protein
MEKNVLAVTVSCIVFVILVVMTYLLGKLLSDKFDNADKMREK